ncbi:MAG: AMP-binding protein [Dysgonamonadaceae bacterium]|nr:AMP-binding protein [Dysgonamonadaceae bacterium]
MQNENFIKLFEKCFKDNFNNPAFSDYGTDIVYFYCEVAAEIDKLHTLFDECGVKKGDKVALVGKNNAHWCIAYMAVVTRGAVVVPILQDFNAIDIQHIIDHSESAFLFTSASIFETLEKEQMPQLKVALSLADFSLLYQKDGDHLAAFIPTLKDKFRQKYPRGFEAKDIRYPDVPDDEVLVLNYTSGTTGFSKGVMITGGNLSGNITFAHRIFRLRGKDNMLSFLPLAHTYGTAFEFLYALSEGCHITLLGKIPSPKILIKAFDEIRPVLILSVPLILEKIYKKMLLPLLSKRIVKLALRVPPLRKAIYKQIRSRLMTAFGGNFKQIIIGGAPLNAEVEEFMQKIDFPVSVGYGMTECAPLISFSLHPDYVPHSCGKVLPCMEARIDSEDPHHKAGEIQVRGQNVMRGYYKNEEATRQAFTADGWLRTGDLGTIDPDNNLFIRGRLKSVILSASGQNIYPEEIEAKLDNLPFILESLVVERKGRLIALVCPDADAVAAAGIHTEELEKIMKQNQITLNRMVASYEKLAEIQLHPDEFEKTPKRSIKRYLYQ